MAENQPKRRGRPKKQNVTFEVDEINQTTNVINPSEDFLSELNNINYNRVLSEEFNEEFNEVDEQDETEHINPEIQEYFQTVVENHKSKKRGRKPKNNKQDEPTEEDDVFTDDLFSTEGSKILGKEKRELIAKLNQYKQLFPNELKKFKVSKFADAEQLQDYLDEMEIIVSTSSVDGFITDSIISCIRIIEGVSASTEKYDISGCADLLKQNKQFHNLTKQLYVKYKVFSSVPPEFQLTMLIATTAFICKSKNQRAKSLNDFLNETIQTPPPAQ